MNAGAARARDGCAQRALPCRITPIPYQVLAGKRKIPDLRNRVQASPTPRPYCRREEVRTSRMAAVWQTFRPASCTAPQVTTVYETLERPLGAGAGRMEMAGIAWTVMCCAACRTLSRRKDGGGWRRRSTSLPGRSSTWCSPAQLGEILFEKMGLGGWKRPAKTGKIFHARRRVGTWRPSMTAGPRAGLAGSFPS